MGSVISKTRAAVPAASAPAETADSNANTDTVTETTASTTAHSETVPAISGHKQDGTPSTSVGQPSLPADMQFILESGLHIEPEDERSASSKVGQGSIQDAVNDIKAKYNLNKPVQSGELERIRKEIELKTKLMEMREAAQQRRMAAVEATSSPAAAKQQDLSKDLFKVDVKGKGRADAADDRLTESEDDESSSSEDESDSGSSSSSGSSLDLKRPTQKGKQQQEDSDSDEDGSDDDFVAGKLKPEEIAQATAAFASQHEIVEPSIAPPPVDTIPQDAPLRAIGRIDHIINSVIVIRADMNTQEGMQGQILDEGSLLCLNDRRVLGAIFETFGSVNAPFYSIRLPPGHQLVVKTATSDGAESDPVQPGMQVFYSPTPDFSGLLYTRDIRKTQMKGSDASNLYDEEVGENEIEFSDDEQEVAYRRDLKQRKKERWAEKQQGGDNNAEFEFDEDFDDAASVRSAAHQSHDTAQAQDSEEEGAIVESTGHKRQHSNSTAAAQGPESKSARVDGNTRHARGRGGRPERGHGRGRGGNASQGQPRGRGSARGGMERGRGRGQSRGSGRGGAPSFGAPSSSGHYARPSIGNSLPPRPSYQHPDALPYDDLPSPYVPPARSNSPVRPQHALPPRPSAGVEQYDPSSPQSQHIPAPPPRGMNAFAQPWSPQHASYVQPNNGPYVPSAPFFPHASQNLYNPLTFGGLPAYGTQSFPSFQHETSNPQQNTAYAYTNGFSGVNSDGSANDQRGQ